MQAMRKPCPKCGREMVIKNITPAGYEWECSCGHLNKKQKFTKTKLAEARSNLYYAVLTGSEDKEQHRKEFARLKKEYTGSTNQQKSGV